MQHDTEWSKENLAIFYGLQYFDNVSRFSNALAAALGTLKLRQSDFANQSGIDFRTLNKYVRGSLSIGPAKLEQIARNLPDAQRAEVVAAWLRDLIPQSASGNVGITTAVTRIAEKPNEFAGDLAPELDAAMKYLTDQACRHTEISDLLIDLERALRGQGQSG